MKRLVLVIMMSLLLTSVGFAAESEKSEDIVGYGEYTFGSMPSDFDLSDFDTEVGELHGVEVVLYTQDYDFAISAGSATAKLYLTFEEGVLENVMLIFDSLLLDIGGLDDVKIFVKGLRKALLDKYDVTIMGNRFGFEYYLYVDNYLEGILWLMDEDGNAIMLNWDGYDITLSYCTSSFWEKMVEGMDAKADEGESKL